MKRIKKSTYISHLIVIAMTIVLASCEMGVNKLEEPQPISNGNTKSLGGLGGGGTINVPPGVNIVSFVNFYHQFSTFRLSTGLYYSSGILTRNGVTIVRNGTSSVPRIKGWMDIRGVNNVVDGLTWDGDDWTGNSDIGNPLALVYVTGQNNTVQYCNFRDIDNLHNMVLIWAGVTSSQVNPQTVDVSNLKIQYNIFSNWKQFNGGYLTGIQFGSFSEDVPPAIGAHIRWNQFSDGPTAGMSNGAGNAAIVLADDELPYLTGYNPHAYQPINVQGNNIQDGWDALSIKVNNCVVRYNVIRNSNSGSSPGIQNRFGSWNIFEGNLVSGASSGAGILIASGDGLLFRNNVIRDSRLGVLFKARNAYGAGVAGDHILLTNNTFVRNEKNIEFDPGSGAEYSPHDDVVLVNNIFYRKDNTSTSSFWIAPNSQPGFSIWTSISYMGYDIFANDYDKPSTGTCHSCQEPASTVQIFDHVATNNFDIETGSSPAVNAGVTWSNGMPTEDFERKNRPVSTYDIGALEKNGY